MPAGELRTLGHTAAVGAALARAMSMVLGAPWQLAYPYFVTIPLNNNMNISTIESEFNSMRTI